MASERYEISTGMTVAIFIAPLIFGWTVMKDGVHLAIKATVGLYMLLSLIPVYLMVSIFWTSGGDVRQMAKDFDRNREVANRNADVAKGYMNSYANDDGAPKMQGGMYDGMNAAGDMVGKPVTVPERPATANATRITINAADFAKALETGRAKIADLTGHSVTVNGVPMAAPQGNIVYLTGGEQYPAVKLTYNGTAPTGNPVHGDCRAATMGISGPEFTGCE